MKALFNPAKKYSTFGGDMLVPENKIIVKIIWLHTK